MHISVFILVARLRKLPTRPTRNAMINSLSRDYQYQTSENAVAEKKVQPFFHSRKVFQTHATSRPLSNL